MSIAFFNILPENLVKRLQQEHLTDIRCLIKTSNEKFRKRNFNPDDIRLIRNAVSNFFLPPIFTIAECLNPNIRKWKRITTGCKELDKILDNGISVNGITEICGESGSGKSQICMQLAICVQLPECLGGLGRGAVYIATEEAVPASRLLQIAQYFNHYENRLNGINFSDNIFIDEIYDMYELHDCMTNRLPYLMDEKDIGIIIIDSIGAIFRTETNFISRAENMRKLCDLLLKLSDKHNCAVVCVNQVTSVINKSYSNTPENQFVPCLGLAWANLVNTRLQIHRTNKTLNLMNNNTPVASHQVRKLEVLYAPDLKQDCAEFLITSNGVSSTYQIC